MSKSDTDSNSESYKSLSDDDGKMLTAKEDDSTSDVESSDETVEPEMETNKIETNKTESQEEIFTDATDNLSIVSEETTKTLTDAETPASTTATTTAPATDDEGESNNVDANDGDDAVDADDGGDDVELPTTEAQVAAALMTTADSKSNIEIGSLSRTKYSRAEKKARRLLIKQGAKPLPNISRLVMRQGMVLFVIEDAEIYKNPRSDTFIVFGEVKIEDVGKQQQNILACSQIKAAQTIAEATKLHDTVTANKTVLISSEEEATEEAALDETGIDPTDINLVMSQASTTRAKAVRALRANNSDIVNAIMELTM